MQQFTVDDRSDGRKLVRIILARYPALAMNQVRQALRRRDIRVNGKRQRSDVTLAAGDLVSVYLPDALLSGAGHPQTDPDNSPLYTIIYQDEHLLVVNKRPGVTVHAAANAQGPYLIDRLRDDFSDPGLQLCHRLDRHTGGLVMIARTAQALEAIRRMIQNGQVIKRYRCLVKGVPEHGRPILAADGSPYLEINAFLEKIPSRSDVYIHDHKQPGDLPITTRYRILQTYSSASPAGDSVSELDVELVTGRTHQIRAHLAHLGHPVLGDGKYGRNSFNRHFTGRSGPLRSQQLFATTLIFLNEKNGPLAKLAGRTVSIEPTFDWVEPDQ